MVFLILIYRFSCALWLWSVVTRPMKSWKSLFTLSMLIISYMRVLVWALCVSLAKQKICVKKKTIEITERLVSMETNKWLELCLCFLLLLFFFSFVDVIVVVIVHFCCCCCFFLQFLPLIRCSLAGVSNMRIKQP